MFGGNLFMEENVVNLSLAQVAEIQDDLYMIQEAVRKDPVLSARINKLIKRFDAYSARSAWHAPAREIEEEPVHMTGLSTLIAQAQQQCQQ